MKEGAGEKACAFSLRTELRVCNVKSSLLPPTHFKETLYLLKETRDDPAICSAPRINRKSFAG
jgi:hypothetical protein